MADAQSVATLGLALACVFAFGTIATTLESSISTHPDDVIDLDYEHLPIGKDEAQDFKEQYQGRDQDGGDHTVTSSKPSDEGTPGSVSEPAHEGTPSSGSEPDPAGNDVGQAGAPGPGPGIIPGSPSLVAWILSLLRSLVPFLVLAALVAGAYRYRDRLLAGIAGLLGWQSEPSDDGTGTVKWDPGTPSNPVHAAWVELLRLTNLDNPHTRTPEECRDAAIAAGMDADAVRTITRHFTDVRYGNRPVTDDRVRRARESLNRLASSANHTGTRRLETLERIERGEHT